MTTVVSASAEHSPMVGNLMLERVSATSLRNPAPTMLDGDVIRQLVVPR